MQLQRVAVVGTTCSGKTTFARRLAGLLGSPHIELDALHWEPKWTPAAPDVFRGRVAEAIAGESWVTDGNYTGLLGRMNWRLAETLVWLDYPIRIIYPRLFRRTFGRVLKRTDLWNGNRESLRTGFLSRESLFVWALQSHWRRRRQWEAALREPEFAHLHVVRLRRPAQAAAWLRAVEEATSHARTPSPSAERFDVT